MAAVDEKPGAAGSAGIAGYNKRVRYPLLIRGEPASPGRVMGAALLKLFGFQMVLNVEALGKDA